MSFYLFVMFGLWDIFLRTSIRLKSFFGSMNRGRMRRCYFNLGNNPVLFLKSNLESKTILYSIYVYGFFKWHFVGGILKIIWFDEYLDVFTRINNFLISLH